MAKSDNVERFHRDLTDAALQRELDAALGDMSIEDILDAESTAGQAPRAEKGAGVRRGTVIAVQGDDILLDMGGKSEGLLPARQFEDEPLPAVGDTVEVTIEGFDGSEGLLKLSRLGAIQEATWETLEEGQLIEGRVTGHNKGGLEVVVNGIEAFCPISQIERFRVEELAPYVNQRYQFLVTEVNPRDRKVVLSRRSLLEQQAAEAAAQMFETLAEGQTVTGTVKTIMPYGAFVDIGGMDGLLHVKDMSHGHVADPKDIVAEGDKLEVMILKVDREERKIGLGLKQVMPDPWAAAEHKWPIDSVVSGRITRLADFGAFVELEPGVEGLVPIGEMTFGRRIAHPREIVDAGEVVRVRVMNIDTERRRIGLSIKRAGDDPWLGASARWPANSIVSGVVTRIADFGAFVELAAGVEGLVHISELSDAHVRTVSDAVREGQTVQAKVLEVDEPARRISLSIKQAAAGGAVALETAVQAEAERPKKKRKRPLKGGLD